MKVADQQNLEAVDVYREWQRNSELPIMIKISLVRCRKSRLITEYIIQENTELSPKKVVRICIFRS